MGVELEYKYLINKFPEFGELNYNKVNIVQHYCILNDEQKQKLYNLFNIQSEMDVFRVRKITTEKQINYILTLKSKGLISREEYECDIDENMFLELSSSIESTIVKNRYTLKIDKYKFEFDEYLNLGIDLKTVEVELNNADKLDRDIMNIESILKNELLLEIEDITTNIKYKNSNLYKYFKK